MAIKDDIITNETIREKLKTNEVNIVFGRYSELIEEAIPVRNKSSKLVILIRNRELDGDNGKPIPHEECTVKMIRQDIYKGPNGKKGLPVTVEAIELYKKADNNYNRTLLKKNKDDVKYLKKIIKDNKEEILMYWNADPYTEEGQEIINDIRNKISKKYNLNLKLLNGDMEEKI